MTMFREDLLACRDCQLLQPAVDDSPTQRDELTQEAVDEQNDFIARHAAHRLSHFRRHGWQSRADRPLWDPMVTITFEVTDGQQIYVATCARQSIDEPRVYQFAPGSLEVCNTQVAIDVGDLRRGLDRHFYPHAIRPSKVQRFVAVLCDLLNHVVPDELQIAFDASEDPAVSIARMPDTIYAAVSACCADIFDAWELERVRAFLSDNRDEYGLLALRVRREFRQLNA
jgi:hypothetical protein